MVLSFGNVIDTFIFFILLCLFWAFLGKHNNYTKVIIFSLIFKLSQFTIIIVFTLKIISPPLYLYIHFYLWMPIPLFSSISLTIVNGINLIEIRYLLYFLPFVMLNLFFLLPLPPAIIFLKYKA